VEGGDDVGSRVRIAAATCLVASGLFAAGTGATIAFADPSHHGGSGDNDSNDSGGTTIREGLGHDHGESGQAPANGGNENRPGVNGMTSGVGPLPGGTGNEHSGNVGTGKTPADHKPRDTKPDERTPDDQDEDQSGEGEGSIPPSTDPTETPPTQEPGCDEDNNDDHCSPDWPWWPWPPVGQPPGPDGGGGGGGGVVEVPSGRPQPPPEMQLPPELKPPASEPAEPGVISPVPGIGVAAAELPLAPLTLPVIVSPPADFGGGAGSGGPNAPALPGTPRGVTAEPPAGREPLSATAGSNIAAPASSYRVGYVEYLRTAGLSQVAAMAVPGITGILVLTGAGGLVGYRQARAGHAVRTGGTARFMN
jgi:hypothetical protein